MSIKSSYKIGIMLGSVRSSGNCQGLEKWLLQRLQSSAAIQTDAGPMQFTNIYPRAPMHPLGPVVDEIIPALVSDDKTYACDAVTEWSGLVRSCDAFIILTPQYNWGYPGDLKNALDHLYYEWKGKPVMIITYGGHGGEKCGQQLRQVLCGLRMKVIEEVISITLPEEYIRTSARLLASDFETEETDSKFQFLRDCEPSLLRGFDALKAALVV